MIGEKIKQLRQDKKITQEDLGKAIGVTTSMVGMYETNARKPSLEVLDKIANYFDISTDFLLSRTDNPQQEKIKEYTCNSFLRSLGNLSKNSASILDELNSMTVSEQIESGYDVNTFKENKEKLDDMLSSIQSQILTPVPVLGVIRAGEPIRAEQNIIGFEYLPDNFVKGGEYFGLRVTGDSMTGARINDGDVVIVREQPDVENGEIAVVLVDGENATIKKFYKTDTMVTLMPDSANKSYQPRFIDITKDPVKVLGKVVKVIINI